MTGGRGQGLVLAALVLAGCAGAARGDRWLVPAGADREAWAQRVAARARGAEVVYLGEMHDNPDHHAIQALVLEAILAGGGRPALALEMVPETQQPALEPAVRSAAGPAELDRRLGWGARGWPDVAMYWPLFALARRHRLPVVGVDLDPAVSRRIGRGGLAAAGEDPARLRSALPDDPVRDRAIARRIRAVHCDLVSEERADRMLESWYARNVVIARRLLGALEQAPGVVVIIGRGHQSPGGVPQQVAALRPGTRQLVVALAEEGDRDGRAGPDTAAADVVWLTPPRERPDPCHGLRQRLGRTPRESPGPVGYHPTPGGT